MALEKTRGWLGLGAPAQLETAPAHQDHCTLQGRRMQWFVTGDFWNPAKIDHYLKTTPDVYVRRKSTNHPGNPGGRGLSLVAVCTTCAVEQMGHMSDGQGHTLA